jgi:hypothetical protein
VPHSEWIGCNIQFKNFGVVDPITGERVGAAEMARGRLGQIEITINSCSNGRTTGIYWNDNDLFVNTTYLLHELGHALRFLGFQGGGFVQVDTAIDVGEPTANSSRRNAWLIPSLKSISGE